MFSGQLNYAPIKTVLSNNWRFLYYRRIYNEYYAENPKKMHKIYSELQVGTQVACYLVQAAKKPAPILADGSHLIPRISRINWISQQDFTVRGISRLPSAINTNIADFLLIINL